MPIHVSPGERNPIEGKFGQAKAGYGLNRIKARLRDTSETWIACIFLVLNLVKLAGAALPCLMVRLVLSFSAMGIFDRVSQNEDEIKGQMIFNQQILNPYLIKLRIEV